MTDSIIHVDRASADHYLWGDVCHGWRLLNHPDLSIIQERVPPGAGEVRHFHTAARQFFYVLSGEATLEFDDTSIMLAAGQGVHVPPGVTHRFVNKGEVDVEFLVVSAPSTADDRTNIS